MNKQDFEAIRERCERATPGPWECHSSNHIFNKESMMIAEIRGWGHLTSIKRLSEDEAYEQQNNNGQFIAHARTDIPALLAKIDRLQAERDAAVKDIQKHCDTCKYCTESTCPYDPVGTVKYKDNCSEWKWRGLEGPG